AEGVCRFGRSVFPRLRRSQTDLEFLVVGRSPSARVRALAQCEGIQVIGSVPDVRPYLAAAEAVVVPLRIARGIQNKVLEGLAMDRRVLASMAVCQTFGQELPHGLVCCETVSAYENALTEPRGVTGIREAALVRFAWPVNIQTFAGELHKIVNGQTSAPVGVRG